MIEINQLFRFTTAGSVDDGKSTLIGRLLYDSKSIFEDQLDDIEKTSQKKGFDGIDLALFTDGLRDEREQGITIDVAYRYFTTPKRKFIIADTPGHVQYTRNMVTGASTANAALIIIDARNGVVEQTKRHAFIASLLHIPHIIVCVNKMDLVDYDEKVFETVGAQFREFASKFLVQDIHFVPISALLGDNVVHRSSQMGWYQGGPLLHILETMYIGSDVNRVDARFPVQCVLRPQRDDFRDFRGYAGKIESGVFRQGDEVTVMPSGLTSRIKTIDVYENQLKEAFAPMAVSFSLEDDIDISRGDMIVRSKNKPTPVKEMVAMLCWFSNSSLKPRTKYCLQHTTNKKMALVAEVVYKIDVNTLSRDTEDIELGMNDIAKVKISTAGPINVDSYQKNRITGSFILIDISTNETVAAGMVI
ncbi:sulfate adenylyltransferase subunit 1 [Pareuzebyella sediminis]|uniref:sulfate adenylyltransferase subunit 1 n=1 Tax=Pareuzebyella sediminis TaxID=2607998 RepID=UPI0011EECE1C|nr:GTP-binding protein [Pareuzebyella sediminis]